MKTKWARNILVVFVTATAVLMTSACSRGAATQRQDAETGAAVNEGKQALAGEISIDGSSTVYPISSAIGEEFSRLHPEVRISVGYAGTGGGMKRFYTGQIDICDASRPIKQEEIDKCRENNIQYTEFMVAYDGISIVVNKDNNWCKSLDLQQLKAMWQPDSKIKTWKDLNEAWPDQAIKFYAPGTDSGTFEYFTEEIMKEKGAIRTDITPSEDDNVLVTGVAGDRYAIGFFGFAYYMENTDKLKVVQVDGGDGPVEPTTETIKTGAYKPLSRPLFIYVNNKSLEKSHIKEFVKYYLTEGKKLVGDVGYVPLEDREYQAELLKIK